MNLSKARESWCCCWWADANLIYLKISDEIRSLLRFSLIFTIVERVVIATEATDCSWWEKTRNLTLILITWRCFNHLLHYSSCSSLDRRWWSECGTAQDHRATVFLGSAPTQASHTLGTLWSVQSPRPWCGDHMYHNVTLGSKEK